MLRQRFPAHGNGRQSEHPAGQCVDLSGDEEQRPVYWEIGERRTRPTTLGDHVRSVDRLASKKVDDLAVREGREGEITLLPIPTNDVALENAARQLPAFCQVCKR